MKPNALVRLFILAALLAGPAAERQGSAESLSAAVAQVCGECRILDIERQVLVDDIAHYKTTLRVGPGEHDRIALHRVVRERQPGIPAR